MQHQPTPESPAVRLDGAERDLLYLLTEPGDGQPVWSVPDLARQLANTRDADVAITGLLQAGLIYQTTDGFVFASRAAVRMVQMVGQVV
jgi:hypothetical protein